VGIFRRTDLHIEENFGIGHQGRSARKLTSSCGRESRSATREYERSKHDDGIDYVLHASALYGGDLRFFAHRCITVQLDMDTVGVRIFEVRHARHFLVLQVQKPHY
jgi:hypothetical protein